MRRLLGLLLGGVLLAGSLAACAPGTGDEGDDDSFIVPQRVGRPKVDVDTAELRRKKARAGIEACVPGSGEHVDDGLPELTLPCFGGGKDVDLSTLRGPLVINLWAQTCKPCRDEMPILQDFYQQYGDQVQVLGINFQDTLPEGAMVLAEQSGVTYPLLADPGGDVIAKKPLQGIRGLPAQVLVDADGRVAYRSPMVIESESQLVDLVEEHLGIEVKRS